MTGIRTDDEAVEMSRRLQVLVGELERAQGEPMAARARELGRLLTELHGAGLARIVRALRASDPAVLDRLLDDDLVASLLVLHDLHPESSHARVERALERLSRLTRLRLELLSLAGPAARVRVDGASPSGGRSGAEIERLVADAVQAVAPEIENVEVEGVASPGALVQITRGGRAALTPEASSP